MAAGRWLVLMALAFAAGWLVSDWRRDSLQLVVERAAGQAGREATAAALAQAGESARGLEAKLEALKNARPKEIRTEMVKPVFTHVCVSDEFVRMYNAAAGQAERALSGKPENKMPGKPAQN
ncbi:hypothetical protein FEM41_01925 [Jejubacter calystegiae]|uniref:Uncharacterized protein n=1 Tax=Jejubacter calystegiae TaxID=2579935 RepID=A0A4P8YF81_9ENTR|nr:hypothetical protein [Jejubacter calystegiae]QCT18483.1 hypothetical protein FEM41_01925 [Jejubacter calystegiae]